MKKTSKSQARPVSPAKLTANKNNAQHSCGPSLAARQHTRFNALKHGLSAKLAQAGADPPGDAQFCARVRERLGPRNAREAICIDRLLETCLRQRWLLDAERNVLTRRHLLQSDGTDPFPIVSGDEGVGALALLTRYLIHFTRCFCRDVDELLELRKGKRKAAQNEGVAPAPDIAIEEFLAGGRRVYPGEDGAALAALAVSLWSELQPANQLEEFVVADVVDTEWRLARATHLQTLCLQPSAVSATGNHIGLGFGFTHACQQGSMLNSLLTYEAGLRKRLTRLKALWRKLRKQGWEDAAVFAPQPVPGSAADAPITDPASSPAAATLPASTLPVDSGLTIHPAPAESQSPTSAAPDDRPCQSPSLKL